MIIIIFIIIIIIIITMASPIYIYNTVPCLYIFIPT